jgi:hypothetical protein
MLTSDVLGNRKHIRIKSEVDIIFESNPLFKGRLININVEACKISILKELPPSESYRVKLKLPERDVIVDCACMRLEHHNDLYECVLKFKDPSPSLVCCIEDYMTCTLENLENAISRRII